MHQLIQQSDIDEESEGHKQSDSGVQLQLFGQPDEADISGYPDDAGAGPEYPETSVNPQAQSIELSGAESIRSSQPVTQFQLSLGADQLARLWLREPNLNPSNVYAWSSKKGQWVPALSVPEVAEQIARARIESVKMWSVLCASRVSATMLPPPQLTRQLNGHVTPGNPLSSKLGNRLLPESPDFAQQHREELGPPLEPLLQLRNSRVGRLRNSMRGLVAAAGFQFDFYRTQTRRLLRRHAFRIAPWTGVSLATISIVGGATWLSHSGQRTQLILERSVPQSPGMSQSNLNEANLVPLFIAAQPNTTSGDVGMPAVDPPMNPATRPVPNDLPIKTAPASAMPHFDAAIAERAIEKSTARAQDCADGDIYGKLVVTFFSSGYVQNVDFVQFSGDRVQRNCVADLVGKLRISPFAGGPVMVQKNIHVRGAGS